jgi:hypothetical protein
MDEFQEVEEIGLGSNLKNAASGVVVGLAMFFGAFPLLWWNEGRAVDTARMLTEAKGGVVSIDAAADPSSHEGQLVHLQGDLQIEEEVVDSTFDVRVKRPGLMRQVEMYQWKQKVKTKEEKKVGGGTRKIKTYSYTKTWSKEAISSGSFKRPEGHENPSMPFGSWSGRAKAGKLGAFTVDSAVLSEVDAREPLKLEDEFMVKLKERVGGRQVALQGEGNTAYVGSSDSPQIGDLRIGYYQLKSDVSVIAEPTSGLLQAKTMSNGERLLIVAAGQKNAQEMIEWEETKNTFMTWLIRLGGFLLMFFGVKSMLSIVVALANILPFLGGFAEFGTSLIATVIAAPCALITIALAWIVYRPIIGVSLLVVGVVIAVALIVKGKRDNMVTLPDGTQVELPG